MATNKEFFQYVYDKLISFGESPEAGYMLNFKERLNNMGLREQEIRAKVTSNNDELKLLVSQSTNAVMTAFEKGLTTGIEIGKGL